MMFARLPRSPRGLARVAACLGACAGLLALAACSSSPPSHFYTLGADAAPATTRSAAASALLIEVSPVDVPSQVAKNQLVVQTGSTQVQILEQERWASLAGRRDPPRVVLRSHPAVGHDRRLRYCVSGRRTGVPGQRQRAALRVMARLARVDRRRVERARGAQRDHHDVPQHRQRAGGGRLRRAGRRPSPGRAADLHADRRRHPGHGRCGAARTHRRACEKWLWRAGADDPGDSALSVAGRSERRARRCWRSCWQFCGWTYQHAYWRE